MHWRNIFVQISKRIFRPKKMTKISKKIKISENGHFSKTYPFPPKKHDRVHDLTLSCSDNHFSPPSFSLLIPLSFFLAALCIPAACCPSDVFPLFTRFAALFSILGNWPQQRRKLDRGDKAVASERDGESRRIREKERREKERDWEAEGKNESETKNKEKKN